ncbi:LysR family transcriptional regulator [Kitasatospora sp. NPDC092948]|uniref:LysR family transcriptional regulator n=1 Tax=Kitasatospora sp. NPDC092948 TaxID=3364088 RepID=UPI00380FBBE6
MSLRDIEVKLLRSLVAIVDEGGFACAARSLHVTQPTVSQQIQRLESIVEAPLFERTRRPLLLTPVGREVLAHARRVILLNNEVLDRIAALCSQDSLSLGCSVHFADGLHIMLSKLAAERPQLKCSIAIGPSAALADQVGRDELEAAILLGIETPRCERLGRLRLAWYGQAQLLAKEPVPVALVRGRSALSRRIVETLAEHNVPWRSAPWCSDPLAVRASVRAGLAYTALAASVHHGDLSLRPVPPGVLCPEPEPVPVYLAFSPSAGEPVVAAARAAARSALRDIPLDPP